METLQISGVMIKDGEVTANQVLYKDTYDNADTSVTVDDTTIVIQGSEYLGEDRYAFKIAALGYQEQ